MHVVIAGHAGRIFHAAQHPALGKIRPCYAFLPEDHYDERGFDKSRYIASRWPSINAGANPHAIGSHIFPDTGKPIKGRPRCPILREFIPRLETIATVKAIPPAK